MAWWIAVWPGSGEVSSDAAGTTRIKKPATGAAGFFTMASADDQLL
tara:strand:- start:2865 stop:3002 length:138 start_codon:yes stop_codon:yes gene_type:complete